MAILQEMQSRGLGGSGLEWSLKQQAGQAASDRMAGAGFDAAAEGRRQALQSLQAFGGMAGRMRDQDFGEKSDRARAADEIDRFNEASRAGAVQQGFQNQMGLATGRSNAANQAANVYRGQAAQTQQQFGNYGSAVGSAAGAYGQHIRDEQYREESQRERERDRQAYGYRG
jgi:hypothetical protein